MAIGLALYCIHMEHFSPARSILIIEDDPALGVALGESLIGAGYSVRLEVSGEQGLEVAKLQHPDLIVLDLIMPGLGGIGVLRQLRKDPWGAGVPVLVLSNLPSVSKEAESLELGAVAYLLKSHTPLAKVLKVIASTLGGPATAQ